MFPLVPVKKKTSRDFVLAGFLRYKDLPSNRLLR